MRLSQLLSKRFLLLILFSLCLNVVFAQEQTKTPPNPVSGSGKNEDDTLRISADLIQVGVGVFDKNGRFVHDIGQDDFELRVDGKITPISFFEKAAAENGATKETPDNKNVNPVASTPAARGKIIIFVVDELHLALESHKRAKNLILKFIDGEMMPSDRVALVSTNGQLGVLQQFTGDKAALRAAIERLSYSNKSSTDRGKPPMTEFEAMQIERSDSQVIDSFAEYLIKDNPPNAKTEKILDEARDQIRSRAHDVIVRSGIVSRGTYSTLEQVVRRLTMLGGRKIVFFLSDGFLINTSSNDSLYRLQRVTDAAARSNTVIYSFDAKGLDDGLLDYTTESPRDALSVKETASAYRMKSGANFESQDGLSLLADSTGGRFVRNVNDLQNGMKKALDEASLFYLLAWQPADSENSKPDKLKRIEVTVKNRPELKVRVQGGYLAAAADAKDGKNKNAESKTADVKTAKPSMVSAAQILQTQTPTQAQTIPQTQAQTPPPPTAPESLDVVIPEARGLTVSMAAAYLDKAIDGGTLSVSMRINSRAVEFTPEAGGDSGADLEILGDIYDADGKKTGEFGGILNAKIQTAALANSAAVPDIFYDYQTKIKPGRYQVRVALRDKKSGRKGYVEQWVEVPDISTRRLTLSSLILSEIKSGDNKTPADTAIQNISGEAQNLGRSFNSSSALRCLLFIYNAAQKNNQPDLTVQFQILRDKQSVIDNPAVSFTKAGQDALRLPYAADVSLNTLLPGSYELHVIVRDLNAKTSAEQNINFEIVR